jgi:hypothetical protein
MRKKGVRNSSACDPLSRIDSSLEALGGNKWFCTIDLISGPRLKNDFPSFRSSIYVRTTNIY